MVVKCIEYILCTASVFDRRSPRVGGAREEKRLCGVERDLMVGSGECGGECGRWYSRCWRCRFERLICEYWNVKGVIQLEINVEVAEE